MLKTSKQMPEIFLSKHELQMVLDNQIGLWRERVEHATSDQIALIGRSYIDAYQYIREVFIGSPLPVEAE